MSRRKRILILSGTGAAGLVIVIACLTRTPAPNIKAPDSFTPEDISDIRNAISRKNWSDIRLAAFALNFSRLYSSVQLLYDSRLENIAGHPGPPGGARVDGHVGRAPYQLCAYMVYKTTNGWWCDTAHMITLTPNPPHLLKPLPSPPTNNMSQATP